MAESPDLIVVCGPTASGKTRLGVAIARLVDGEIISADSRQVYRGMDIGTGKDLTEYGEGAERVPVHLIDIAQPDEMYNVWRFQHDFAEAFAGIRSRGRMPVAVGGTGLYLEAVLRGYRMAGVAVDTALREQLSQLETAELDRRLLELNPALHARTDKANKRRLVRALEIALTGEPGSPEERLSAPLAKNPLVLCVRWDREELRGRIARRLDERLAGGMLEEVAGLIRAGVTRERLDSFGLEYRYVARHLAGEITRELMREELFRDICRFAKRQMTWFRGMERRGVRTHWVDNADCAVALEIVGRTTGRVL